MGETITNKFTGKQCNVSIEIEFDCDPKAVWKLSANQTDPAIGPPPAEFKNIDEDTCQVNNQQIKIPRLRKYNNSF